MVNIELLGFSSPYLLQIVYTANIQIDFVRIIKINDFTHILFQIKQF
jgi:hypothetical protein